MNLETGATVGQLLLAIAIILTTGGIAWGSLLQRVRTLENQVAGLPEIDKRLTRVETVVVGVQEDVTEIKGDVKTALQELRSFASDPVPRRRQS